MGCCFGIVALIFPRIALVLVYLSGYGATAFKTVMWPLLGFFFMPYTTLAYAIAINEVGRIEGVGLLLIIIGVFFDLGSHGGSATSGRRRVHVWTS
jgi:hypothetical protein